MIVESPVIISEPTEPLHVTIMNKFLALSDAYPDRKAIIDSEDSSLTVSFQELYDRVSAFSAWLQANNYKKGDLILLHIHNGWQMFTTFLGAWSAGLVTSACNRILTHYELRKQILDAAPVLIVTDYELLPKVQKATVDYNLRGILCASLPPSSNLDGVQDLDEIMLIANIPYSPVSINLEEDLMNMPYSSGTSGPPKGMMLTHLNYAQALKSHLGLREFVAKQMGLTSYQPSPMAVNHLLNSPILGMFAAFVALCNGTTQINVKKSEINKVLKLVQDYKVPSLTLYPNILHMLLESPLLDSYDLSCLHTIACGSAPLGNSQIAKLKVKLPHVTIRQGYGLSEMCAATHAAVSATPPQSVGRIMPGVQMKIISEDGKLCGPGEKGEIYLRSKQMMKGYWKQEELFRSIIGKDGFLKTGDVGYFEENGDTYICDRLKDVLKVFGGHVVTPAELESTLLEIPGVKDSCVIGVPYDGYIGVVPRAYVVAENVTEDDINEYFKERLVDYKQLRGGIEFRDAIPRNTNGKLLRRELAAEYLKKSEAKS